jgi:hypothetical protein
LDPTNCNQVIILKEREQCPLIVSAVNPLHC